MTAVGDTAYIVFDVESVVDGPLISRVLYPDEGLEPDAAIERHRKELLEASGGARDFVAVSFHVPVSVCVRRPSSSTPAANPFLMWRTTRRSAIRCSTNCTSQS